MDWQSKAKSVSSSEAEILTWVMRLHNGGEPFDVDATYSRGLIWNGLTPPRLKFDIAPQSEDVEYADVRALPLADACIGSIMIDLPFVAKNPKRANGRLGIIEGRFSGVATMPALWELYRGALAEAWRVLRLGCICAFKCQDTLTGGTNYISLAKVIVLAQGIGFYVKDLFVLTRAQVLWSPNMKKQQHARKHHCYYVVLQKPRRMTLALRNARVMEEACPILL